jgi:hypothetical protein
MKYILGALILLSAYAFGQTRSTSIVSQEIYRNLDLGMNVKEIAFGNVPDREGFTIFAHNTDLDSANGEIITSAGTNVNAPPVRTAASTVNVTSSSASDTSDGTGARSVLIQALDANYDEVNIFITMNGQSNVQSTTAIIAVNRVIVYTAGSGRKNAGNITVTHITDSYVMAQIEAGESVSDSSVFTVPRNKRAFIGKLDLNSAKPTSGTDPEVTFRVKIYSASQGVKYVILNEIISSTSVSRTFENAKLEQIRPRETVWIEAVTTQNDTVVSARMNLTLALAQL